MKSKSVCLAMAMLLLLSVAACCEAVDEISASGIAELTAAAEAEEGEQEFVEGKTVLPIAEAVCATEVTEPMPDGGYSATFNLDNAKETEEGIFLEVEFFIYDSFSPSDIQALQKGDVIRVGGEDYRVNMVSFDGTDVLIDWGGEPGYEIVLHLGEDGLYFEGNPLDPYPGYYSIGKAEIKLSEDVKFVDTGWGEDPNSEIKQYEGAKEVFEALNANTQFCGYYAHGTAIILQDNEITAISRIWTP